MKIGSLLPLAIGLFRFSVLSAADFQIAASLDRHQIALNEQCVLSLTVSGQAGRLPSPRLPDLPDFQVANAGTSQNFSWINGQASSSVIYTFVLTPLKEGRLTIPPIRLALDGQAAETQPLSVDVAKGNPAEISPIQGGAAPLGGRVERRAGEPAIFIQGTVDKNAVYVGEPVSYLFRLYNRIPLLSQPRYQPPEMAGFWAEDLPPQRNYTASIKGIPYNVTEVRTALFPTAPGKARIGSAALSVTIENIGSDPFSDNFLSQFFGRGEERTLRTEPLSLRVKPLPEPKPAGFKGAVGRYALSAAVDKDRVAVGQPLTLSWTVSGKGNIKSLPEIAPPPLAHFRAFDANAAVNIDKKNHQVQGSKVFKTVIIPTTSGDLTIPAISFVFFDPEAGAYRTVSSRPLTVHAAAGAGAPVSGAAAPAGEPASAPGIRMLADDIRYIKTPSSIRPAGKPLYRRPWFLWFHGILFAALAGLGLVRLYQTFFLSDTAPSRFRRARGRALAAVQQAEAAHRASDIRRSLDILSNGLQAYIGAKLSMEPQALSLKQVLADLRARGVAPHDAEKIRNLWEALDLHRFAPAQAPADEIRQTIRTFEHVVEALEGAIAWKA